MEEASRRRALAEAGLAHPAPQSVSAPLFVAPGGFFLALDKVQVKYEMLRAHAVEGMSAIAAADSTATPEPPSTWRSRRSSSPGWSVCSTSGVDGEAR